MHLRPAIKMSDTEKLRIRRHVSAPLKYESCEWHEQSTGDVARKLISAGNSL